MKVSLEALHSNEPESYGVLIKQIDRYRAILRATRGKSTEGMQAGTVGLFVGVSDLFVRIGNTFKANLFRFYKDLKRSEIKFYCDSHPGLIKAVEESPISRFLDMEMDIPNGLNTDFRRAATQVGSAYLAVDLVSLTSGVLDALKEARTKLSRGDQSYVGNLVPLCNIVRSRERNLAQNRIEMDKIFTETRTGTVPFRKAYDSMQDMAAVRTTLLGLETKLQDVNRLLKSIDDIDALVADLTSYITEGSDVDAKIVDDFACTVRFMASAFEFYGINATRQMALEHNHTVNLDTCYAAIK